MADGREIILTASVRNLDELTEATQKMNQALNTFEKHEMPADPKLERNFIYYNRNCKHCKGKNCVTVIEDPHFPNIQKEKLYCSKCQKTWPLTSKASSVPTSDEKLIHSIQVIFKNTRDKLYEEDDVGLNYLTKLSELETKILQRII